MARQRILNPNFFVDEKVVQVTPFARLMFQGLWCLADREGRLERKPLRLKMQLFPADNVDGDALLRELEDVGLVQRYEVDGVAYLVVTGFTKHQHVHPKEVPSKLPPPPCPGSDGMSGQKARALASRVPSRTEESWLKQASDPSGSAGPSGPAGPSGSTGPSEALPPREKPRVGKQVERAPDPRHVPMRTALIETFRRKRGAEYPFDFGREDAEVRRLLQLGLEPVVLAAWERALDSKFPTVSTLAKFRLEFPRFVGRGEGAASAVSRRDEPAAPRPEGRVKF